MIETPPNWGEDNLSEFLDTAFRYNLKHFESNFKHFDGLQKLDAEIRRMTNITKIIDMDVAFPTFLLLRSHAAFLGATRLVLSGQIPEAYMVMRGCLESALYAHYLKNNPGIAQLYLSRHDDASTRKAFRKNFPAYNTMRDALIQEDEKTGEALSDLYEITIDFGAHPNSPMLAFSYTSEIGYAGQKYLDNHGNAFEICLACCKRVGMCSILIYRLIYPSTVE